MEVLWRFMRLFEVPEAVANLKSGIEMDSLLIWRQFS